MKFTKKLISCVTVLTFLLTACNQNSEIKGNDTNLDFPKKDLHIVVPYDAGGGVDITTRVFADQAKDNELLKGKNIIVENKGGGGAVVGQTYVANEKADGYTILAYTNAAINNPKLKEVSYDIDTFKPLSMICFDPDILVCPPDSKFKDLNEFIDYAKNNTVKVATPGFATVHHLAAVLLANQNDLNFEYLHNDSASVQLQQIMGNHCDVAFISVGEATSAINDGTLKGLAVMSENTIDSIKEVPTFKDMGYEMVYGAFRGYAVSKDVPDAEYEVLREMFESIGQSDELKQSLVKANIPYEYKNSEDFKQYVVSQDEELDKILPELKESN